MQSLLLAEDIHQGRFLQQGFKYESVPTRLMHLAVRGEELFQALSYCDSVFIVIHHVDLLDEILDQLKLYHRKLPIFVLSQCFDSKLIHYVKSEKIYHFYTNPYPFRNIANEVRTIVFLQREETSYQVLRIRDLELNRNTHEVRMGGVPIELRHKEFGLLEFLMLNAGKLLSREIILESVWDRNANIFTNTVDVHINKLRKKIDYKVQEKYIHTVHCSGYIFS